MSFGNVAAERAAIESTYEGLCTVTVFDSSKDPTTKVTAQTRTTLFADRPCGLSQGSLPASSKTDTDNTVSFDAKLFIDPDVTIPAGCEIRVVQNGMDALFRQVGMPFRYATHQEIKLLEIDRA
ncbi:hypothetical protein [Paenibacillus ferrarius]|uniref:hypothetical protein n=1 Tax=Paenibacillus ferrarius TaxID=1469647 RepID=UPI003D2D956F